MDENKKNSGSPADDMIDKINETLNDLDFSGLSQSIRESVDFIRKEAENGYRNYRMKDSAEKKKYSKYHGAPYDRYRAEQQSMDEWLQRQRMQGNPMPPNMPGSQPNPQNRSRTIQGAQNGSRVIGGQPRGMVNRIPSVFRSIPGKIAGPVEMGLGISSLILFGGMTLMFGIPALISSAAGTAFSTALGVSSVFTAIGGVFLGHGIFQNKRAGRLTRYNNALQGKDYMMLEDLSRETEIDIRQIRKDMQYIKKQHLISDFTMDEKETCILLTEEARQQYALAEESRIKRELEELRQREIQEDLERKKQEGTKEEKEWIYFNENMQAFLVELAQKKTEIDSPELLKHMENVDVILRQITDCIEEHPEMISGTGHLISYYLPCMSKLLTTYEDLEEQPIQGDNIQKTKKEIENSFETIQKALTNMYDELFLDVSLDISSDIQVMKAMMAQDGWDDGLKTME